MVLVWISSKQFVTSSKQLKLLVSPYKLYDVHHRCGGIGVYISFCFVPTGKVSNNELTTQMSWHKRSTYRLVLPPRYKNLQYFQKKSESIFKIFMCHHRWVGRKSKKASGWQEKYAQSSSDPRVIDQNHKYKSTKVPVSLNWQCCKCQRCQHQYHQIVSVVSPLLVSITCHFYKNQWKCPCPKCHFKCHQQCSPARPPGEEEDEALQLHFPLPPSSPLPPLLPPPQPHNGPASVKPGHLITT